jgi:hypothetical protein
MMLLAATPGIAPFQRVLGIRNIPYRGPIIRVMPGVLGNMAPSEDLLMLPDQGVVFEGNAYRVGDLVDGIAIRQEDAPAKFMAIDILIEGYAGILVQGATLELGLAMPSSPTPLRRVPVDADMTNRIALMSAEIALEAAAEADPSGHPHNPLTYLPKMGDQALPGLQTSAGQRTLILGGE